MAALPRKCKRDFTSICMNIKVFIRPPINAHIPMYAEDKAFLDRPAPYFDAHINLLKSRRVIPRSSGKPDLRF
jgi:hypothetical protein